MKYVLPLSIVVVPVVAVSSAIAPSIVFVPAMLNVLVFLIPLVNFESVIFNVPALVTALPLKPYTSPTFANVNVLPDPTSMPPLPFPLIPYLFVVPLTVKVVPVIGPILF